MAEHNDLIQFAYEELSEADQLQIDLQVKQILDYYENINRVIRMSNWAIFPFSRANALELLYQLGRLPAGVLEKWAEH